MSDRIPSAQTVLLVLVVTAVLTVWQSVGWLWGTGRFEEDVRQAQRSFVQLAPRSYRIEFSMGPCMCFSSHERVTVVAGEIVKVEVMTPPRWDDPFPAGVRSTSTHLARQDQWVERYVVFPEAFDVIAGMSDADVVELDLHGNHGLPSRVYVDWRKHTFDDELTYHWRGFEILDR